MSYQFNRDYKSFWDTAITCYHIAYRNYNNELELRLFYALFFSNR